MEHFHLPKANRGMLLRAAGTLAALALLVYLLRQQGWGEVVSAVRQIDPWRLGVSVLLIGISRLAVTARWHLLLRAAGLIITPGESLRITFAGLFATNFLPTTVGGDIIRLAGAIQVKQDAAISAASLIADRLVGMAGMAMMLPIALPRFLEAQFLAGSPTGFGAAEAGLPFLGLGSVLLEKIQRIIRKMTAVLGLWLRQPGVLLLALVFTWIHMACIFGILWLLFAGMGEEISFWLLGGLYSLVYFVSLIPITINGYGLQELSLTYIFTHLGGVDLSSALTAALLFRTLMMLASLPGALFLPGLLPGVQKQILPDLQPDPKGRG